jgi:hypothetical protein
MNEIVINLRAVDRKRLDRLQERTTEPLTSDDVWYITGCEFQVPQNSRRLINVYAINFMP